MMSLFMRSWSRRFLRPWGAHLQVHAEKRQSDTNVSQIGTSLDTNGVVCRALRGFNGNARLSR